MDQFQQKPFKIGEGRGGAFDGGVITVREPALIPFGGYSVMENVKKWHPGITKRGGMQALHFDFISFGSAMTLYQFSKGERHEIYTYIQLDSGAVQQLNVNPPSTNFTFPWYTTPFLGTAAGQVPASWSDINDILVYSNGSDQHQTFPGEQQKISGFVTHKTDAITRIPATGRDVTDNVLEDDGQFVAVEFASAATSAWFIMTKVPANKFNFIFDGAATGTSLIGDVNVSYPIESGIFVAAGSIVDGTHDGTRSFSQDGSISFSKFVNGESPTFMFGQSGYWYRLDMHGAAPAVALTNITPIQITYDGEWEPMKNVWDGILIDVIEAQYYLNVDTVYDTFPASSINISGMTSSDKLYVSAADAAYGIYIDVGATPNKNVVTITVKHTDGQTFIPVLDLEDGTNGFTSSGFISWRKNNYSSLSQFNGQSYYAHWYEITVNATVSDNVIISALYMPQYNIGTEFGSSGICSSVWKNRGVYTMSIYDRDIYVSANGRLNVLNGTDFAILEPGDGRRNRTVCIKKFHNEIIAWQEEKGRDGGCTTLFEGYSPSTFGKLVLSSQVGTLNAKSAVVIDGATTVTKNDDKYQTMAYWISHYGIFMTDGRIVTMISADIQNYFDNDFPDDCIRLGYENEMWVEHDIDRGVLRFGLVTGPSATKPNTFPVFDLEDGSWSFDTYDNPTLNLNCALQCEAETGTRYPIIHIGANDNGLIYLLNYEYYIDDGDPISMRLKMELNHVGFHLDLREANIRFKATPTWGFTQKNVYENGILITDDTEQLTNEPEVTGQAVVRHRVLERIYEETNISLELINAEIYDSVYLLDMNMDISAELNK